MYPQATPSKLVTAIPSEVKSRTRGRPECRIAQPRRIAELLHRRELDLPLRLAIVASGDEEDEGDDQGGQSGDERGALPVGRDRSASCTADS